MTEQKLHLLQKENDAAEKKRQNVTQSNLIRYHSKRDGLTTVTFTNIDDIPEVLRGFYVGDPTYCDREETKCVITGLPAKYRDPETMLPYANLEAYKILKNQYQ